MSNLNSVLVIKPETGSSNTGSAHISHGHLCPYCNGRGEFTEQTGYNQYKTTECPRCKGIGKLAAKVVVGWYPDIPYFSDKNVD